MNTSRRFCFCSSGSVPESVLLARGLDIGRVQARYPVGRRSVWVCLGVLSRLAGTSQKQSGVLLGALSLEPTSGGINLAHLGKGVSSRFLHPEVTILPFVIGKFLAGGPWGPCKYPVVPPTFTVCLGSHC